MVYWFELSQYIVLCLSIDAVIYYRVIGIMRAAYKIENLPRALLGKIILN